MIKVVYERSGNYWSVRDEEGEFGFIARDKKSNNYTFKLTEEKYLTQEELKTLYEKLEEFNRPESRTAAGSLD